MADKPRFKVRFDEAFHKADLDHATTAGAGVARRARQRLERDGIAPEELRKCAAMGDDGTRLAGCVKTYLPPPEGRWGMVLCGGGLDVDGTPVLLVVAFGERHPRRRSRPSVYQLADERLHGKRGAGPAT